MSKFRRMFYEAFAKAGSANTTSSSLDKPLIKDVLSIDFETANIGRDACSLGVVHMKNDEIVFKKNFLIDPEAYFQPETIQVHGITPQMVLGAPTFPKIMEEFTKRITPDTLVIAHNAKFDLDVLKKKRSSL